VRQPISLAAALALFLGAASQAATIEGRITYQGKVPQYSLADDLGRHTDLFEVNRQDQGLRFVVVYLRGVPAEKVPAKSPPAVIDQKDYVFLPHVLAVRAGQPVKFTNSDPANHNVRSTALEQANQMNVYTGLGGGHIQQFEANRAYRPIRLGCDIHGWMRGWIYVFDHPWFAVTDSSGRFALTDVPTGTVQLEIRQPDGGLRATRTMTIKPGERLPMNISFSDSDLPETAR
jgi:plastocyanin